MLLLLLLLCWLVVGCICVVVVGAEKHPCVHSKRLRVYIQKVHLCTGTKPTCMKHVGLVPVHTRTFRMYSRRRFERVHGFFHVFSPCRNTHKHTHTHQTHTTTTQHNTETETERERETRQDKKRENETRQEGKTREERR